MARVVLGKRAPGSSPVKPASAQTPCKRTRHGTSYSIPDQGNDENQDPREVEDVDERPRKQARLPVTPSTPRHRDALASQTSTPRHAVMSAGKLFRRMTPQSPLSPSTVQTVYHGARQLFARGVEPGRIVGREAEREQLSRFLDRCETASPSPHGCLYVSGAPGTGKSALVVDMTRDCSSRDGVRAAYINCMSIKSSKDLYVTLLSELGLAADATTEAGAVSTLQQAFCPKSKSKSKSSSAVYQVTLDEMDHVLTMGLESLYRIVEWSLQDSSRLVLIGIANALDLTDRFLPRLKARNLKPELLTFLPYTAVQVKNIITTRLRSLMPAGSDENYVPFIHPAAIELCSRKVSSQTGDLRKAFEICRRALDLVEAETRWKHEAEAKEQMLQMTPSKKRPLGENVNGTTVAGPEAPRGVLQVLATTLRALTAETAPRASIGHLSKITAAAFGNGTTQRLKTLNLQQKAALCALVAYERRSRDKLKMGSTPSSKAQTLAPSIKMLFDTYSQLCTRDSLLHPLSGSEFREVVGSLETLGLVSAVEGKNGSFVATGAAALGNALTPSKRGRRGAVGSGDERRIASCVGERDVEALVEGVGEGILGSILGGEALD
ncbi:hypothetical protein CDD80_3063 [Ophiocordyceps camponoti-rufipedis]|uniref:Cell division control protein n=1 Tax=Ophiocordyceps camponoti-rufipedis TaxID=2004952 RepID=A0A2C5Z3P2_9HYPO|nr:hypothetical protein CDD80_3063 [Ophiocordyceps camponoti-rufipedis]